MAETAQERRNRITDGFNRETANWVNGLGTRPLGKFKMIEAGPGEFDRYKVFDSYEDYLAG